MSQQIFLHIGTMKTGTTYLQSQIFPLIKQIEYSNFQGALNTIGTLDNNLKYLISNEGVSGNPYRSRLLESGQRYYDQFKTSIDIIKSNFEKPKIIICFREPHTFIESSYKQYLHEGGTLKWESFFGTEVGSLTKIDDFKFSKFIKYLEINFNEEDLFIYNYSDFKNNNLKFVEKLMEFLQINDFDSSSIVNNTSKKSNKSIPLELENYLITANKFSNVFKRKTGRKLQIKIGSKVINSRVLLQYLIPKLFKFNKKRDLTIVKELYINDWNICIQKFKSINDI